MIIKKRDPLLHKLFYYILTIIVLASNTDFVRAATYYFTGEANVEEALAFMKSSTIVDRLYMLAGNAFNYASVFFFWVMLRKRDYFLRFSCLWAGLVSSAVYFFISTWNLWMPIAQGANMSENFAMGFVKITLYTNIVGLLCCLLGLTVAKQVLQKQNQ
jgi:hypothetical protein